ncbi:hypothetical protein B0H19DRAFT_1088766 [Mycena capillaripes]|nr:hypothetical protein B0H19DRAFT_1088766 [Mycena capillaripes]
MQAAQHLEDAEALKFAKELRLSLFHSFHSVKFDWSDLDGMRSVRRRYNSSYPASSPPLPHLHHVAYPPQVQAIRVGPTPLTHAHARRLRIPHQRAPRLVRKGRYHPRSCVRLLSWPPHRYYGFIPAMLTLYDSWRARAPPVPARSPCHRRRPQRLGISPPAPASSPSPAHVRLSLA